VRLTWVKVGTVPYKYGAAPNEHEKISMSVAVPTVRQIDANLT
jgi:hypothetical protein